MRSKRTYDATLHFLRALIAVIIKGLDIDFSNSAGFEGYNSDLSDGHFIVYFLSHAMVFCVGAVLEAHVILTPASCVFGEKYKFDVFGGTHTFLENVGFGRKANHICVHRGYNHTKRWESCFTDNMAMIVVAAPFQFSKREVQAQFAVRRLRYGVYPSQAKKTNCKYFGWGSRRNGYLLPLLIHLREVNVRLLPSDECNKLWNYEDKYICLETPPCKSQRRGALCPDDLGTVLVCDGFLQGMMTSRLIDRPCGVGFINMVKYMKFITCGVDGTLEVLAHEQFEYFEKEQMYSSEPKLFTLPEDWRDVAETITMPQEG